MLKFFNWGKIFTSLNNWPSNSCFYGFLFIFVCRTKIFVFQFWIINEADGESLAFSTLSSFSEIARLILAIAKVGLFSLDSFNASSSFRHKNEMIGFSAKSSIALTLVAFSNSATAEIYSVSAS